MADEKIDEETYSLIYSSLKHPIRRKILRMLDGCALTFSAILETLAIDSGHLSYHLDNLGELITRTADGKYTLSSFGMAAVKLMNRVEDNPAIIKVSKSKLLTYVQVFSIVLAVALLVAGVYAVNYTRSTQFEVASYSGIPLTLESGEPFAYPITFVFLGRERFDGAGSSADGIEVYESNMNNPAEWVNYRILPTIDAPTQSFYVIQVTLYDPDGIVIHDYNYANYASTKLSFGIRQITQLGNYQLEIRNIGPSPINQTLDLQVYEERFQKPVFYYGVVALTIVSVYLIVFCSVWLWTKRRHGSTGHTQIKQPRADLKFCFVWA